MPNVIGVLSTCRNNQVGVTEWRLIEVLSEEIRKRVVIEQVLGFDNLSLPEAGRRGVIWSVGFFIDAALVARRRPMALPAGIANALDLAVHPQLVHDFPETLDAGVGHKGAQIQQLIPAIRFHSIEDGTGVFAQGMHRDTRKSDGRPGAGIESTADVNAARAVAGSSLLDMTAERVVWPATATYSKVPVTFLSVNGLGRKVARTRSNQSAQWPCRRYSGTRRRNRRRDQGQHRSRRFARSASRSATASLPRRASCRKDPDSDSLVPDAGGGGIERCQLPV
jgi:hypothetical protein